MTSSFGSDHGNSPADWEIFDELCKDFIEPTCTVEHITEHHGHSLDLVTTLRSELAASSYKRDRLMTELTEAKSSLCAKDTECESLRSQTARQSALIGSLQGRLQASEARERNLHARCESSVQTLQREKRGSEDKNKELMSKIRRLEIDLSNEESHKDQARAQLHEFVRKLCVCLGIDVCESSHLTPECVLSKAGEVVSELQRLRTKMTATCDTLNSCEAELLNLKSVSCAEKQRLTAQLETLQAHHNELEARCRTAERDLQVTRDRLSESDICGEKLREELRGLESRCHRLQTTIDRFQGDRLQFLRGLASVVCAPEPCETLVRDKVREIINENQTMHTQLHSLRDQLSTDQTRYRESQETNNSRLRAEEVQKCALEERLEKANAEIQGMRSEHVTLADFLVRLARALCWNECTSPPAQGSDTNILADSLLERSERLAGHHEHHLHTCDKNCFDHHHHHHHHPGKLRRERSCHDIPLKDSSAMYSLQRRVRVLREQVQRRDLHLELLRRKIALLEDGARTRSILQSERDDAVARARRTMKQVEKLNQQLHDVKVQLNEVKNQLAEAAEFKIAALERARKIDELTARICDLENDKVRLHGQATSFKERARSAVETSEDRRCRDETLIRTLREDMARVTAQLADCNHKLTHLQTFRASVARTLHLRDIPETDLLHRLQTLCNAHQEFTMLSRRYEAASPVGDHPCPRFDELLPPTTQCRPISSSPRHQHPHKHQTPSHQPHHHHSRRYDESHFTDDHHHHFDDEFDFNK